MNSKFSNTYEQVIAEIPYNEDRHVRMSLILKEDGERLARIQVWSTNSGRNDRWPDSGCIMLAQEQLPAVLEALKKIRYATEPKPQP
ncbi:hypothetical protein K2Z84_24735 [Candidatus Binatia bacterium]|nr:hypothetical protein [Candidatus Binatia bacterium]